MRTRARSAYHKLYINAFNIIHKTKQHTDRAAPPYAHKLAATAAAACSRMATQNRTARTHHDADAVVDRNVQHACFEYNRADVCAFILHDVMRTRTDDAYANVRTRSRSLGNMRSPRYDDAARACKIFHTSVCMYVGYNKNTSCMSRGCSRMLLLWSCVCVCVCGVFHARSKRAHPTSAKSSLNRGKNNASSRKPDVVCVCAHITCNRFNAECVYA